MKHVIQLPISELAELLGQTAARALRLLGRPGDAYIVITIRNTPELDGGSDQSLVSNMAEADNIVEILRSLTRDLEQRRGTFFTPRGPSEPTQPPSEPTQPPSDVADNASAVATARTNDPSGKPGPGS